MRYAYADISQTQEMRVKIIIPDKVPIGQESAYAENAVRMGLHNGKIHFPSENTKAQYCASVTYREVTEKEFRV